jgi:hypothetical protein
MCALEQLCMLLLLSDNIDHVFEMCVIVPPLPTSPHATSTLDFCIRLQPSIHPFALVPIIARDTPPASDHAHASSLLPYFARVHTHHTHTHTHTHTLLAGAHRGSFFRL